MQGALEQRLGGDGHCAPRPWRSQFRGDLVVIYDRLKADDCPASKTGAGRRFCAISGAAADAARRVLIKRRGNATA